ncbi:MAG: hypothetical protein KAG95_02145 [Bacteroidales bacterium]|nr:hypothetical protein [Bacteroidales bacterium]
MKKHLIVFLFLNAFVFNSFSQILVPKVKDDTTQQRIHNFFGFSLVPTLNGSLITFAIVRELRDGSTNISFISKDTFILQAMGMQTSKANPKKESFFKKYNISPATLEELWKLRYSQHPYSQKKILGWSNKESIPSPGQMIELKKFGIENMFSYCYGKNAFELLQLIQDPSWVARYKGL